MLIAFIVCLLFALGALGLDWLQTLWIARNPDKTWEINVILGKHPSVARVCWYFAVCIVLLVAAAVALYLGGWPRVAIGLCALVAIFEAVVVGRNFRLGIPFWSAS